MGRSYTGWAYHPLGGPLSFARTLSIVLTAGVLLAACGSADDPGFGDDSRGDDGSGGATETGSSTGGGAACVDLGEPCSACEVAACEARYCACYEKVECGLYAGCALECGKGLFEELRARYPDEFSPGQLRTLQRRVRHWRAQRARALILPGEAEGAIDEWPTGDAAE